MKKARGIKVLITATMLKNYLNLKRGLPAFAQIHPKIHCYFCVFFAREGGPLFARNDKPINAFACVECPWVECGKYDWMGCAYMYKGRQIGELVPPCIAWLFGEVQRLNNNQPLDHIPDFEQYHRKYNAHTAPIIDKRIKMLQQWLKQLLLEQLAKIRKDRHVY